MFKRALDLTVAGLGVVLLSPVLAIVAIVVKLESSGPALHRATRVGKEGQEFTLYKFRTMRLAAGPAVTRGGDPRITRSGRVLRRLKIDEVPQLFNVLIGDMSLVGPRPEDPKYVALYTEEQRRVLSVRPGITSPTAVAFRHEEELLASLGEDVEAAYIGLVLPQKLRLDLEYVTNQSAWTDVKTLLHTLRSLFQPAQAPSGPRKPRRTGRDVG